MKSPEDLDDLIDIIVAACELEKALYQGRCENRCGGDKLFTLRKALEGIFGHDLPYAEPFGQETK